MTRHAAPEERRLQLAEAALAVAAEVGLDAVTVARVAAQAGVSVGLVQHHFPTKQELMVQVYGRALERVLSRVAEVVAGRESAGSSIRDTMVAGLAELLPTDADRRAEAAVRAQFHGRAVTDQALAEQAAGTREAVLAQVAQAVTNGRECGETAAGADPIRAAWGLWALTDGLAATMLATPDVPAVEVLTDTVTRVFPHPCTRR